MESVLRTGNPGPRRGRIALPGQRDAELPQAGRLCSPVRTRGRWATRAFTAKGGHIPFSPDSSSFSPLEKGERAEKDYPKGV